MSALIAQFLEIIANTWRSTLYCEKCGHDTTHIGHDEGRDEVYVCVECQAQKAYTVR